MFVKSESDARHIYNDRMRRCRALTSTGRSGAVLPHATDAASGLTEPLFTAWNAGEERDLVRALPPRFPLLFLDKTNNT